MVIVLKFSAVETKLLTGLEVIRIQVQLNTQLLQRIIRQLEARGKSAVTEEVAAELPEDIELPLKSREEVLALDVKLQDPTVLKQLVSKSV